MSKKTKTGDVNPDLVSNVQDFLNSLSDFEDSGEGYGNDLRLDLADIIIQELRAQDITQKELADRTGMKPSFISRIVHAESNCTLDVAGRILFALGARCRIAHKLKPYTEDTVSTIQTFNFGVPTNYGQENIISIKEEDGYIADNSWISQVGVSGGSKGGFSHTAAWPESLDLGGQHENVNAH